MFSGIIEEVGSVLKRQYSNKVTRLEIRADKLVCEIKPGDSISINGVCLTAETVKRRKSFSVCLSAYTEKQTSFEHVKIGDLVNLEQALRSGDKIGGHFLTGHVDFKSPVISLVKIGESVLLKVKILPEFQKYIVPHCSIGLDGVSLTVSEIRQNIISLNIIPYTLQFTTLLGKRAGDLINVEIDMFAKYVDKLLWARKYSV